MKRIATIGYSSANDYLVRLTAGILAGNEGISVVRAVIDATEALEKILAVTTKNTGEQK